MSNIINKITALSSVVFIGAVSILTVIMPKQSQSPDEGRELAKFPEVTISTLADGSFTDSGTFMPMAASDGPHYGANIKLNGDGLYTVTFTVKFPDSSTYLIHTDETGPETHEFPAAIVYTYDAWQFTDGAWAE